MQSIQKINVDISRDRNLSEPSVYAKQNDSNSRNVEVTLFDSGVQLSSLTAPGKVFFGKGNNSYFEKIEITNGVTEFTIPQNALSSSGRIQAEILILKDNDDTETLTSASFIINCHAQINPSGAINGENNGDILGQILERIEQIQASNMSRTALPDGPIDLNTFITSGWWYTTEQRIDITNTPKDLAELELIVTKDAPSITQILIACDGGYGICYRFSHNSGKNWTDWQKIASDADFSSLNETLADKFTEVEIDINKMQTDIDALTTDISNFRVADENLQSQINEIEGGIPTNLVNGLAEGSLRSVCSGGEQYIGDWAVTLGYGTQASGLASHAEGFFNSASGDHSHAEGQYNHANGENSHAEGSDTIANGTCQHVQGRYNIEDKSGMYAHIVGNGHEDRNGGRSNAHTLDWNGNAWFASDVYVGGTSQDDESATKLSSVATDITQAKEKLDGIEEGANKTIVDSELSNTSTNPVQNKVVSEKIKNHASFSVLTTDSNEKTYIKLGKFTGNGAGGRAIFTINGKVGWNNKNDGGLKILTLSSNDCRDSTSTDIWTGGSMFDFGRSDNDGTAIIEDTPDIQIALVRPIGYSVKEVDVYLKFAKNKYNSYLFTVDFTDGCNWETEIKSILTTDPDPMETALSAFVVPKKFIGDNKELKAPKEAATATSYTAPYCQSGITVSDLTELKDYRTTLGAVYVSSNNAHSNIISVRHRNGAGDGAGYGMYIAAPLKIESDLKWRNQANGNWGTEKTLLDSSNFKTYIPYETGTCTLSASNGTVSNATYSVVGNMVTLNFNIAPTGAGNVVVSGLPFTATKNQSGFASSTATYNITANQTSVSINSTSGTAEYCTVTYLK